MFCARLAGSTSSTVCIPSLWSSCVHQQQQNAAGEVGICAVIRMGKRRITGHSSPVAEVPGLFVDSQAIHSTPSPVAEVPGLFVDPLPSIHSTPGV